MYQREVRVINSQIITFFKCLTTGEEELQQKDPADFGTTAKFCPEYNKENKLLPNPQSSRVHRRIHFYNPVAKLTRPVYKELNHKIENSPIIKFQEVPCGESQDDNNSQPSSYREMRPLKILLDKDAGRQNSNLSPKDHQRSSSAAGNYGIKIVEQRLGDQIVKEKKDEDSIFNFTFSPTKRKGNQTAEGTRGPRSESHNQNRDFTSHLEEYKENEGLWHQHVEKKSPASLNKSNKIKVLSPVPDNDCFSPPLIKNVQGRPKAHSEFKQIQIHKLNTPADPDHQKYVPFSRRIVPRNVSTQRNSIVKTGCQLSPLLRARERSVAEKSSEVDESSFSSVFSKEGRCKLPLISSRRNEANHTKILNHNVPQNFEERLNMFKIQYGSEPFMDLRNKVAANPYNKSNCEETIRVIQRLEPYSAGVENQKNPHARFRAEEIILKKIFRPPI